MEKLIILMGGIVVYILIFVIPLFVRSRISSSPVPQPIKLASLVECCWGVFMFFGVPGIFLVIEHHANQSWRIIIALCGMVIGMGWFVLSAFLSQGSAWAKFACLVLCILRLPTVVGIPFSVLSVFLLYRTAASLKYYSCRVGGIAYQRDTPPPMPK